MGNSRIFCKTHKRYIICTIVVQSSAPDGTTASTLFLIIKSAVLPSGAEHSKTMVQLISNSLEIHQELELHVDIYTY
jgi:hypothetical protein